jgi:hypothetical protein
MTEKQQYISEYYVDQLSRGYINEVECFYRVFLLDPGWAFESFGKRLSQIYSDLLLSLVGTSIKVKHIRLLSNTTSRTSDKTETTVWVGFQSTPKEMMQIFETLREQCTTFRELECEHSWEHENSEKVSCVIKFSN